MSMINSFFTLSEHSLIRVVIIIEKMIVCGKAGRPANGVAGGWAGQA